MAINTIHYRALLCFRKSQKRVVTLLMVCVFHSPLYANEISLYQAQQFAISQDPFLKGNSFREEALSNEEKAAAYWANPQLSSSIQNLPTDGFSLNQEPMTQVKVGIKQQLPRGNVNTLSQQKTAVMARKLKTESDARKALLNRDVAFAWLDWYLASQRIALLSKEKSLLTQLLDVTESRYSSVVGSAQQDDILQVRLALMTLQDKYTQALQKELEAKAALSKWYGAPLDDTATPSSFNADMIFTSYHIDAHGFIAQIDKLDPFDTLQNHPLAEGLQLQTQAETKQLDIAREQTKSQWSVEASYGYRQDAQNGMSRADFVSVGVQVDLPVFTRGKQTASISAAAAKVNASKTDFRLKVNELAAQAEILTERLFFLNERKALYEHGLVSEVAQLAQTLLTSYTADTANFSDVVNANIRQIQVQDELLRIQVDEARTLASLAYLYLPALTSTSHQ